MTNGTNDEPAERGRRVIHATCAIHPGSRGFCNLVITREDGDIILNPHTTGACVLILDETEARSMRDVLTEWLG
ncbi:MAG TPA: hypothetical protein VGL88_06370 [Pseudonocardiaceae bacterium]